MKDLLPSGCHIEPAKVTPRENNEYCTKEGKFAIYATFDYKFSASKDSLSPMMDEDESYMYSIHYIRHKRSYDEVFAAIQAKKQNIMQEEIKDFKQNNFRNEILTISLVRMNVSCYEFVTLKVVVANLH